MSFSVEIGGTYSDTRDAIVKLYVDSGLENSKEVSVDASDASVMRMSCVPFIAPVTYNALLVAFFAGSARWQFLLLALVLFLVVFKLSCPWKVGKSTSKGIESGGNSR